MTGFRFLSASDSAVIVEFGDRVDRAVNERVLALGDAVHRARLAGVTDVVPTFRSLMIHYDALVTSGPAIEDAVTNLAQAGNPARQIKRRLWFIPACYEPSHAPDIEDIARTLHLTAREVAELHATCHYHVYMIGFVPGFPYMGDVAAALQLPRRADPRTRVPPGSVAIATNLTAIYPYESPGGWHLIGTTPIRFFDAATERGSVLQAGDAVAFEPVTAAEFDRIKAAVARNDFVPASQEIQP
ncbi:5-oxoprolinase subunit PxpB [Bradyrhizobium sp. 2TAF24]|uniref:5-oxoprolinase subunit PxpB n=1 Tax=Bradyrhizobium sp. 2TAF24 TaxID=3233011 RepID=UPI003F9081A2